MEDRVEPLLQPAAYLIKIKLMFSFGLFSAGFDNKLFGKIRSESNT